MTQLTDIFGQPVNVGDYIAAGMARHRSSVLRIGKVTKINDSAKYGTQKWSITVEWTHNGQGGAWDVKRSAIKWEENFRYAKFAVLPKDFVEKFPPDLDTGTPVV